MSNVITINGQRFETDGSAVVVGNGRVKINGETIKEGLTGVVHIEWTGGLASLQCDSSVKCGDVGGDVRAAGSVDALDVGGSVSAGGSVKCRNVKGGISASGSVSHR